MFIIPFASHRLHCSWAIGGIVRHSGIPWGAVLRRLTLSAALGGAESLRRSWAGGVAHQMLGNA